MTSQVENTSPLASFFQGFRLGRSVLWLAVLPFVVDSVFLFSTYMETTYRYLFRIGFKFSLPFDFPSITNMYDFPASPGFQTSLPFSQAPLPLFLVTALVHTMILAYASAGYLGKMNGTRIENSSSFVSSANKYFVRFLAYGLLWLILTSLSFLFIIGTGSLATLYVLFLFAVYYLVFMTPFAIVVDDLSFSRALSRSIHLATSMASRTLPFVILFALVTVVVSVPVYLVMNIYVLGFFLAGAASALMGTFLVASTLHFYAQMTQPAPAHSTPQVA